MVTHMGHLPLFLKEVLPIVADAATIISFTVLVLLKLLTIPLQSEWLTLLKKFIATIIRSFFIPSVALLRMNPCIAGLAQRHEIFLVMRLALCQCQLMVYLLHWPQQPFLSALLTERVLCSVAVTLVTRKRVYVFF